MLARISNWRSGGGSGTKGQIFHRGSTYRILWTFGLDPAGGIVCRFRSCPTAEAAMHSTFPGAWTPVLQNGRTYPFSAQSLRALQALNAENAAEIAAVEAAAADAVATGAAATADGMGPVIGFPTTIPTPSALPISIFDKRLRVAQWHTRAYKAAFFMYWTAVSFTLFCLYWVLKQRLLNVKAREVVTSLEKVTGSVAVGALVAPVTFVAPHSVAERCRDAVQGAVRSVTGAFFAGAERLGCYDAEKQERDDLRAAARQEARSRARGAGGAEAAAAKPSQPQEWLEAGGARLLLSVAICLLLGYTVF